MRTGYSVFRVSRKIGDQMNRKLSAVLLALTVSMAGCSSTGDENTVSVENDPRIGEEVSQACFTRNISGWAPVDNDNKALIAVMRGNEHYKVDLSGPCDPDLAMMRIAIQSRPGSSCLSRGDKIKTDGDLSRGYGTACTVTRIYEWDPDALDAVEENKPTDESKEEKPENES